MMKALTKLWVFFGIPCCLSQDDQLQRPLVLKLAEGDLQTGCREATRNIAIIGAGIGGASAAYWLSINENSNYDPNPKEKRKAKNRNKKDSSDKYSKYSKHNQYNKYNNNNNNNNDNDNANNDDNDDKDKDDNDNDQNNRDNDDSRIDNDNDRQDNQKEECSQKAMEKKKMKITVYERSKFIGGRTSRVDFHGHQIEVGASLFHSSDANIGTWVKRFGLKFTKGISRENSNSFFGVWDHEAKKMLFQSSDWSYISLIKLLWRYWSNPMIVESDAKKFDNLFSKILGVSSNFTNISTFLQRKSFFELLQKSGSSYFEEHLKISQLYSREIVSGLTRHLYGQDITTMHALAVRKASLNLDGSLFSINKGLHSLSELLLESSDAEIRLETSVKSVKTTTNTEKVTITTENGDVDQFDAVIIATPLENSNIHLDLQSSFSSTTTSTTSTSSPFKRKFEGSHITIVLGHLKPSYFSVKKEEQIPLTIYTKEPETDKPRHFSSLVFIGLQKDLEKEESEREEKEKRQLQKEQKMKMNDDMDVLDSPGKSQTDTKEDRKGGSASNINLDATKRNKRRKARFFNLGKKQKSQEKPIYKITSRHFLSDDMLQEIFESFTDVHRHHWTHVSPTFTNNPTFDPVSLSNNVIYNNAFESVVSCLECSTMASLNSVRLITSYFKRSE